MRSIDSLFFHFCLFLYNLNETDNARHGSVKIVEITVATHERVILGLIQ